MIKPKPAPIVREPALDYHECRDYIHEKYNIDTTRVGGWEPGQSDPNDPPYRNFWHTLLDDCPEIGNGTYFEMTDGMKEYYSDKPGQEWKGEIYDLFETEFKEYFDEEGFCTFWVDW